MAANLSQLFVGLFNASTGAYANQFKASDANALASVVSLVAGKDLSSDTAFVNYALGNLGVPASGAVRDAAFAAVSGLLVTQGRGGAVAAAADYLANVAAKDATNQYYAVGTAFVAKVTKADAFTANYPAEANVATLVSGATGVGGGTQFSSSDDLLVGSSGNDIFAALSGTLATADKLLDSSTTDNDSLTISFKTGDTLTVQPTITKIENITINNAMVAGASFDATNVTGATITTNITQAATDGAAEVKVVGNNNVTAGAGVTKLTVTGLKGGTVTQGSAKTLTVTTAETAAGNTTTVASVATSGESTLKLNQAAGTTNAVLLINASGDSVVTLEGAGAGTVTGGGTDSIIKTGAGKVTVKSTGVILSAYDAISVDNLTVSTVAALGDTINLTDSTVGATSVTSAGGVLTLDNFKGGIVNLDVTSASVVVDGKTSSATSTVNFNKATPTLALADMATATVNAASSVATATSVTYAGTTTYNVAADHAISTLLQVATTDKLVLAGTGNVTVGSTAWTTSSVDASALIGKLTATQTTAKATTVVGGASDDTITLINTTHKTTVTTGAGNDKLIMNGVVTAADKNIIDMGDGNDTLTYKDAGSLTSGTDISVKMGAGDDTVNFGGTTASLNDAASKISIDFGDGNDTLALIATASLIDPTTGGTGTVTLTGLENLKIKEGVTLGAGVANSLAAQGTKVIGSSLSTDVLTITKNADVSSYNLSGLVMDASVENTVIDLTGAAAGGTTVVGTNIKDVVTLSAGAKDIVSTGDGKDQVTMGTKGNASTVDMGAGDDTFIFTNSTTAADTISITGGTGKDTYTLSALNAATVKGKFTIADFQGGVGGDVLKIGVTAAAGNDTALGVLLSTYEASDVVSIVNATIAGNLGVNIDGATGTSYVVFDTEANIKLLNNAAAVGMVAIASDTGKVFVDADGDFAGAAVQIGTITLVGTLTADNFSLVAA